MHLIDLGRLTIPENRQRKLFDQSKICDLAESIARRGLMHPLVARREAPDKVILVSGERRLRAIADLNEFEIPFKCDGKRIPFGSAPVLFLSELNELAVREAELEENVIREDLTLQERCAAVAELHKLRLEQKAAKGEKQFLLTTSEEIFGYPNPNYVQKMIRIAENATLPGVAEAKSISEAHRVIERAALKQKYQSAASQPALACPHDALMGDSIELMLRLPPGQFDCIVTDPPYGVSANRMNTFGTNQHGYADGEDYWRKLMEDFASASFTVCAEQAHAYVFCSIDRFFELSALFKAAGWKVWKFPLIWYKHIGLNPAPDYGPQRTYEAILFANKGMRKLIRTGPDVLDYPLRKETSFAAEKPLDVYEELLSRSVGPGSRVLDPFMGSGTIFPSASRLHLNATGIERDPETFKIALGRMNMNSGPDDETDREQDEGPDDEYETDSAGFALDDLR